jgi:hypothetical protein
MKGIAFTDPLVRAILEGRKTVTRRRPRWQPADGVRKSPFHKSGWEDGHGRPLPAPPGLPGDVLYVREAWANETGTGLTYRATHEGPMPTRWRPGMFLPAAWARLFVRVTSLQLVRLTELDDAEAHIEGIASVAAFREGWDRLHAHHPDVQWDADPWVWRLAFERCEAPEELAVPPWERAR